MIPKDTTLRQLRLGVMMEQSKACHGNSVRAFAGRSFGMRKDV